MRDFNKQDSFEPCKHCLFDNKKNPYECQVCVNKIDLTKFSVIRNKDIISDYQNFLPNKSVFFTEKLNLKDEDYNYYGRGFGAEKRSEI